MGRKLYLYSGKRKGIKEMHCEAASYPKYVPIIQYEEFDFDTHRLDMIFIHNPYDIMNYNVSAPVVVREIRNHNRF